MGWFILPRHEGTEGWIHPEGAHSCFITTYSAYYGFPRAGGESPPFYLQCDPVFVDDVFVSAYWYTGPACYGRRFFWTVKANGVVVIDDVELFPEQLGEYLYVPFVGVLSELTLIWRSEACTRRGREVWLGCGSGHVPGPVANFEATPLVGYVPLTVQFTDISTLQRPEAPPINRWEWSFGDGVGSYEQNPMHTYIKCPRKYSVQLAVSNQYQSDSELKPEYVETMCPEIIKVRGETRFLLA